MTALERIKEIEGRHYGTKCPKCLIAPDLEIDFLICAFRVMREIAVKDCLDEPWTDKEFEERMAKQ